MNLRLFPLLLFAATSLLTLKAFDMVFSGEALLSGATEVRAEEKKPEEKSAEKAAEKPATTETAKPAEEQKRRSLLEAPPAERPKENIVLPKGEESAETALGERLGEKRRTLEDRTKELELRESLLKAAEKKLDDRMVEVKQIEAKIDEQGKVREEQTGLQIKSLVLMYETMKAKQAAAIFDKLDLNVMVEVASRMKPQMTAQVLANMTPDSAQKLTTELARRSLAPDAPIALSARGSVGPKLQPVGNPKELPRIDSPPPKQN
jgi:flagellar motility protein MotE (MotC chaperone)